MAKLKVFYGFTKLTAKAVRKPELAVWFENGNRYKDNYLTQKLEIVHERLQSENEKTDALECNRMFSKVGYFIDEKPWNSDIEKILEHNFLADSNNVTIEERELIRNKLRAAYYPFYQRKKDKQLRLTF